MHFLVESEGIIWFEKHKKNGLTRVNKNTSDYIVFL